MISRQSRSLLEELVVPGTSCPASGAIVPVVEANVVWPGQLMIDHDVPLSPPLLAPGAEDGGGSEGTGPLLAAFDQKGKGDFQDNRRRTVLLSR